MSLSRASGLGFSRSEATQYYDDTSKWVLGQIAKVLEPSSGREIEAHNYFAASALRSASFAFGRRLHSFTYAADGTLASRADGAGNTTTFSSYKAGLARAISYPNGSAESATVSDIGRITRITGAAGFSTSYGYDTMGRLASITPPSGWAGTTLSLEAAPVAEFGLPAGHWRQTISKGNARTVSYFDALWRPLMTRNRDAADEANTRTVLVKQLDHAGRLTYESNPQRDIASVDSTPAGRRSSYDGLGRPSRVEADSELGTLSTTHAYLGGFQTQQTNPRGKVTTQSFWALDDPASAALASVLAPAGVAISIDRDSFGKPTAITRSGSFNGYASNVTRRYVYDAGQRLCKTIEPEVGATVQVYDAASNKAWKAPGQALPNASSCDDASVPASAKISYAYTPLNQLASTHYGDANPGISRSYTPDGLPLTVSSDSSTWTYGYNSLRQLATETLAYGGSSYGFAWGFDGAGNLSTLTYPNGSSVAYSPNALGQPRSVSGYASAVSFHPNGAVAGYTLANGIAHSLTQNSRGLPLVNRDAGVMQDQYVYDANGNVTAISDQQEGVFSRSMGYDDLDRLTSANAPSVWGNASYAYDPVDNLRAATVGVRASSFNIGPNNQLVSVSTNGGTNGSTTHYSHDPRGNLAAKGLQSFRFDLGNRLSWASLGGSYSYDGLGRRIRVASTDGSTRMQVYSSAGQLLWATSSGGPRPASSTAYIYLGGKQIAEWNSVTGTQYVHTDALGSPVAHSNAAGGLMNRTRFEAYGFPAQGMKPGPNTSVIGFTGHVQDAETDLVYMQQRYYDPVAGRFLSVDPVVTDVSTGAMFNRFVCGNDNPYRSIGPVDPDDQVCPGLQIESDDCASGELAAWRSGSVSGSTKLGFAAVDFEQSIL